MNLLLIFGGVSSEHNVSKKSCANIFEYIDKSKYNIHVIHITLDGEWKYIENPSTQKILAENVKGVPAILSPDVKTSGIILLDTHKQIKIDCIFPVLHGKNGEDGTLQGLLELTKIPYVGCGVSASANSMDKSLTKTIVEKEGVKLSPCKLIIKQDYDENVNIENILQNFDFPVFVKPCSSGSSVGVYKANNKNELCTSIEKAFEFDFKVLVEKNIVGKEIEVAILGNENPIASFAGEVQPTQEFYSFDAKYIDNSSKLHIPARIDDKTMEQVRKDAVVIYKALGCKGLSRVDFFVTDDNEIIFNEINTLPGFTNISMYPKLFEHSGIEYSQLIDELIKYARGEKIGQ